MAPDHRLLSALYLLLARPLTGFLFHFYTSSVPILRPTLPNIQSQSLRLLFPLACVSYKSSLSPATV